MWQEGGEYVALLIGLGVIAIAGFAWWLVSRKKRQKATLIDPALFRSKVFQSGVSGQLLQQIALGGTMIVLPLYLQMVLEYNAFEAGLSIAPLSLSMFVMALLAGRRAKGRPANIILLGFILLVVGLGIIVPIVPLATSGWWLTVPLIIAGAGLGLLVSQLNNYTLSPISNERVSEAAGVNSAAGSFGLSFGLAFAGAIMLATLAFTFTAMTDASTVLPADDKAQISSVLEEDAQLMSTTQLNDMLAGEPQDVQDEVIAINERARPIALQVALFIPILAGLIGIGNAFRMRRLPDPEPSDSADAVTGLTHRAVADVGTSAHHGGMTATLDDVRAIALALPGAHESIDGHRKGATWRTDTGVFVWERGPSKADAAKLAELGRAWPDGPVVGVRTDGLEGKEALLGSFPGIFFTIPHFDGYPAVLVRLDAVELDQLREVITDAWLLKVPKRVAAEWLAGHAAP